MTAYEDHVGVCQRLNDELDQVSGMLAAVKEKLDMAPVGEAVGSDPASGAASEVAVICSGVGQELDSLQGRIGAAREQLGLYMSAWA